MSLHSFNKTQFRYLILRIILSFWYNDRVSGMGGCVCMFIHNAALIWQKEANDKSDISRKRANVSVIYTDVNGISGCLNYLLVG